MPITVSTTHAGLPDAIGMIGMPVTLSVGLMSLFDDANYDDFIIGGLRSKCPSPCLANAAALPIRYFEIVARTPSATHVHTAR